MRLTAGSDEYISFGDNYDFAGNAPFTVGCWVKFATVDATIRRIFDKAASSGEGWRVTVDNVNGIQFDRLRAGIIESASSGSIPAINTPYFVVCTYDSNVLRIYVNGAFAGSAVSTASLLGNTLPLLMGERSDLARPLDGWLQYGFVMNAVLTGPEILALYSAGTGTAPDTVAPTLQTASIVGDILTLKFSELLDESAIPDSVQFIVRRNGVQQPTPTLLQVNNEFVTLQTTVLSAPGDVWTVSYAKYAPITASQIVQDGSATDATSYVKAVTGLLGNKLYVINVASWVNANGIVPNVPTVTGCGITWNAAGNQLFTEYLEGTGTPGPAGYVKSRVTVFWGWAAAPSDGNITIDFGGQTQLGYTVNLHKFDGADLTDPIGVSAGAAVNDDTATDLLVSLPAFEGTASATFLAAVWWVQDSDFVPGLGTTPYIQLGNDDGNASTHIRAAAEWKNYPDQSADFTLTDGFFLYNSVAAFACEIRAQPAPAGNLRDISFNDVAAIANAPVANNSVAARAQLDGQGSLVASGVVGAQTAGAGSVALTGQGSLVASGVSGGGVPVSKTVSMPWEAKGRVSKTAAAPWEATGTPSASGLAHLAVSELLVTRLIVTPVLATRIVVTEELVTDVI